MPAITQRSFTGGEIAPPLYSRCDTTKYATGLRTMRNMFIMRHGGAANRTGSKFVGEIDDSSKAVRLIDFIFSTTQTYMIELGQSRIRFVKNGAYVTETAQAITSVTTGSTTVINKTGHGLTTGQEIVISGSSNSNLNRNFKVLYADANSFQIRNINAATGGDAVVSTGWTAPTGGTFARIYAITSPYLEADLPEIHYIQSADVMTLTHKSYQPYELKRVGETNWTMTTINFQPSIDRPGTPVLTVTPGGGAAPAGTAASYLITAIKDETYEESYACTTAAETSTLATVTGTGVVLTWTHVTGAREYNVYKKLDGGVYGFIAVSLAPVSPSTTCTFTDRGITRDTSITPPIERNPFITTLHPTNWPATCTYVQQRLGLANLAFDSEMIHLSKTGQFHNFTTSSPIQEDDAVSFRMAGRQVNEIRHLLDLGQLIIFTASGEWGMQSGAITPTSISTKQFSYNGASSRRPIVVNNTALYVQARGSIVRDIGYNLQTDGYTGNDLTVFSSHLFDGYQIVDWAYQKVPHSIVWAVRDDGSVIGLTYVKEHEIVGWHRHDFEGGFVENVCSIPEGDEDVVYFVVRREVDGITRRYIERMPSRRIDDLIDAAFLDSHMTFDGRNTTATSMTLSGSAWTYTDTVTATASASVFDASYVGKEIHLVSGTDTIRFQITAYNSATEVEGKPNRTVPVAMRSAAITTWSFASKVLTGLWHLEGMDVSVFGDSTVVGSPYNDAYQSFTVSNGSVTLDKCYSVIHVGLPITSDLETLDIDTPQGETMAAKKKNITKLSAMIEKSVGFWAGQKPTDDTIPLDGLTETKVAELETYENQNNLITGTVELSIAGNWNSNGRVFIRNVDPLPLSVLAIIPTGFVPIAKGG